MIVAFCRFRKAHVQVHSLTLSVILQQVLPFGATTAVAGSEAGSGSCEYRKAEVAMVVKYAVKPD